MLDYKKIIKSRETRIKILKLLNFMPDKIMLKIQYRLKMGKNLNFKNPKSYTEKLQWYKANYRDPLMSQCADKYRVRKYVEDIGLGHILNEVYGVYDNEDDIEFEVLPQKFVMKDTLGGGSNSVIVCENKKHADLNYLRNKAKQWLGIKIEKVNFGREWVYCNQPHRVLVEKYIESTGPNGLVDWKFFCFNGKVEFLYWLGNREIGKSVECGIFDKDFNLLKVYRADEKRLEHKIKKPDNFEEMKLIAEQLSKEFPHVRVDLYNENNKIIFGELTFFPGSGYMQFVPNKFDYDIGDKFILPKSKEINRC